jgi:integrase
LKNMKKRLTDRLVRDLPVPPEKYYICWDAPTRNGGDCAPGFGLRITAAGHRAFILNYRTSAGRERRLTIGSPRAWTVAAARDHAAELMRRVDAGDDPLAEEKAGREAPTMADLADRFEADELPKRRKATQLEYSAILRRYLRPSLGKAKVAEIRHADIEKLHRKIAETAPYRANRTVAVLSRIFNLAIKWGLAASNPAKGIERKPEEKREGYLSPAELAQLAETLEAKPCPSADAIRLLLLTGARRGEVLGATWDMFDVEAGIWVKPSAHTKQKKTHRVPLSAPALALLSEMHAKAGASPFLFPGAAGKPQSDIKHFWQAVCRDAKLENVRLHDLRHCFASILVSSGLSLPIIGRLLGHTQPQTTHRYAHLCDDPLRVAAEIVGKAVTASKPNDKTRDEPVDNNIISMSGKLANRGN